MKAHKTFKKTLKAHAKAANKKTTGFHRELTKLLHKFAPQTKGAVIHLQTHNFSFKSEDVSDCPDECKVTGEVIRNGKKTIETWCEC